MARRLISIFLCIALYLSFSNLVNSEEIYINDGNQGNKLFFDDKAILEGKNGEAIIIMPDPGEGEEEYWITTLYITEEAGVLQIEPENVDSSEIKKELEDFRTLYLWAWIPLNILLALAVALH